MEWVTIFTIVVGWVAAAIGAAAVLPQCHLLYKTKDTESISLWMYILYFVGCIVWLVWANGYFAEMMYLLSNDPNYTMSLSQTILACTSTIFLNAFGLFCSAYILFNKIYNILKAKKINISEREFSRHRLSNAIEKKMKKEQLKGTK